MTCGHVLADKWEYYKKRCDELKKTKVKEDQTNEKQDKYFDAPLTKDILDELELTRQCCRRHFLGHVDLIEII